MSVSSTQVRNFGRNVSFEPTAYCIPCNEAGVLEILTRHRGEKIRAIGSLHSWSDAPKVEGVVVDLRNLNTISVERREGGYWTQIGAGCQIKKVLQELDKHELTLPAVGLITEQTIAGAAGTATHGSGRQSISHFVAEVRVALYDAQTGEPVIKTFSGGPELLAARTGLGLLGIVVSVGVWCRAQYRIEEEFRVYDNLLPVLDAEQHYPLQQFFVLPWIWKFMAQHRRETEAARSKTAWPYRKYWFFGVDIGMHLIFQMLVKWLGGEGAVKFFYRRLCLWLVIRRWRVVDKSHEMLVMEHELFRHIEIEMFVERPQLPAALEYLKEVIESFSGNTEALSAETRGELTRLGLLDELLAAVGVYTHHYVICIRRVLPDETLISMTADRTEDSYAVSLISYARPQERSGFFRFANFISRSMQQIFGARPHWGKYCPLTSSETAKLYPQLPQFREVCQNFDPNGVFRNKWANEILFAAPANAVVTAELTTQAEVFSASPP